MLDRHTVILANPAASVWPHEKRIVARDGHLTRQLSRDVTDEVAVAGAAGICLSPDGKFVYVAAETSQTISVFRRTDRSN